MRRAIDPEKAAAAPEAATALHREIFDGAKEEILAVLGKGRFDLWVRDAAVERVCGRSVTLAVPTEVHRTWLEYTYGELLRTAFGRVLGDGVEVKVRVDPRRAALREVRDQMPADEGEWRRALARVRPVPTLAGFVADGPSSFAVRLLEQATHGNADPAPPSVYQYGDAGSGKTHLLRAVEAAATLGVPGSAAYLPARRLTERVVEAVRTGPPGALRALEADLDARRLILVDDLQELENRPATQRALDGLFDRATGKGVRFVLAGRTHPRDLSGLSERLRSRLLGGVVHQLFAPTTEQLVRLLAARGRTVGIDAPLDVLDGVVSRTRGVPGSIDLFDRWAAVSARMRRPAPVAWLDEIAPTSGAATPTDEVVRRAKDRVAAHYGVARAILDRPSKQPSALHPRRVAMYLVWRAAALPLSAIAKAFGARSHTTVSRALDDLRERRETDPTLESELDGLLSGL